VQVVNAVSAEPDDTFGQGAFHARVLDLAARLGGQFIGATLWEIGARAKPAPARPQPCGRRRARGVCAAQCRELPPDGRVLVLVPAADHLRELRTRTSVGIAAHKLERRFRVADPVHLGADAAAALSRMGPWVRHDVTPGPLETATVAVELSVYRPRLPP
jgi:hypothetical protein